MRTDFAQTLDGQTLKCRNCGKVWEKPFYCVEWGYWYGAYICCSHKCVMEMRRKDRSTAVDDFNEKPPRQRPPLTQEEIRSIEKLVFRGFSNEAIATRVGRSKSTVGNIRKRMVEEGKWITAR